MNRRLADAVTMCTFHPSHDRASALAAFTKRDWKRSYHWLDTSGLALHFHRALTLLGAGDVLPNCVQTRLQQNWSDSEGRVRCLLAEFRRIHAAFEQLGPHFTAHKGFSLVPDFCPDARMRVQFDNDFRISEEDAPLFQAALERLGYRLFRQNSGELIFDTRPGFVAQLADTYRAPSCFRAELHFDDEVGGEFLKLHLPPGYLQRRELRSACGESIYTLGDRDRFLDQAGHFLRHFEMGWIRLSWALEIATFCERNAANHALWNEVREFCLHDPSTRRSISFVMVLLETSLAVRLPAGLDWVSDLVPARMREWIARHGRFAMLAEFPGTKLPVLLLREIPAPKSSAKGVERARLLPIKVPPRVAAPVDGTIAARVAALGAQMKFVRVRAKYHLFEGIRYWFARRQFSSRPS